MAKRKRETADEELATRDQRKTVKKQKTKDTTASQAKASSKISQKNTQTEKSTLPFSDRSDEKLARRLAKREKKAFRIQQRGELGRGDGIQIGKKEGNTNSSKTNERKRFGKQHIITSTEGHESPEQGERGGQNMIRKHKSKKKKSKDRTVGSNDKKSKDLETVAWKLTDAVGGQMLDVDPVFSPDEK